MKRSPYKSPTHSINMERGEETRPAHLGGSTYLANLAMQIDNLIEVVPVLGLIK